MRTRCVWTAAAASTHRRCATRVRRRYARRSGTVRSCPARTACSASSRMRAIAARSASGAAAGGEGAVDLGRTGRRNAPCSRAQSAPVSTGRVEHEHVARRSSSVSRMLARLPKRVFSDITWRSRKLSIGGLVTWLKFWRKNWLIRRGLSRDDRERRIVAHRADRFLGVLDHRRQDQLHILQRLPGGDLAAGQLGAVVARTRRPSARGQIVDACRNSPIIARIVVLRRRSGP